MWTKTETVMVVVDKNGDDDAGCGRKRRQWLWTKTEIVMQTKVVVQIETNMVVVDETVTIVIDENVDSGRQRRTR